MANLSDISVVNIFKGIILDSLTKDGFIQPPPPPQESFFSKHKKLLVGGALVAGAALGSLAIGGVVAALGFGEAVAAGSLVSILQSVGAAGLGIGGTIAAGAGGSVFVVVEALLNILENSEGLAELETFVSITSENDETDNAKVIFDLKHRLLASSENEILRSFLNGVNLAQQVAKNRTKQFEFKIIGDDEKYIEESDFLLNYLKETYGTDHVTSEQGRYSQTSIYRTGTKVRYIVEDRYIEKIFIILYNK